MSARTEQLLTEISELEQKLAAEPGNSQVYNDQLKKLRRELTKASEALTEGKQVLKG